MRHLLITILLLPLLLVGLPLAGLLVRDVDPAPYLEFPPQTVYVQHAPFSWPVFILLTLLVLAVLGPLICRLVNAGDNDSHAAATGRPFPRWGYGGFLLTAAAWLLAWTRFDWFAPLQAYTFFPLWLGYIICLNSLTYCRTGHSLLTHHRRYFLALFPLSALFWWFFEYLNRFVQNWHYLGVEHFSAATYVIHASLCFSTVLPAVLSTEKYLASFSGLTRPLKNWQQLAVRQPAAWGWLLLLPAAAALAAISLYPDYLFPMLWVAPLLIITGVQAICGEATLFRHLPAGDWRQVWLPALAALVCGFFWEMWNYQSLAHWEYSVPFVQRYHVFAMPILGYAGYLPFGLECLVVGRMLDRLMGSEVYRYIRESE